MGKKRPIREVTDIEIQAEEEIKKRMIADDENISAVKVTGMDQNQELSLKYSKLWSDTRRYVLLKYFSKDDGLQAPRSTSTKVGEFLIEESHTPIIDRYCTMAN